MAEKKADVREPSRRNAGLLLPVPHLGKIGVNLDPLILVKDCLPKKDPRESGNWFLALQHAVEASIDRILAFVDV